MEHSDLLRKKILVLRDELSERERKLKSDIITEKIFTLCERKKLKTIFVYVSFRSEVSTFSFIDKCLEEGIALAVPKTFVKKKEMAVIQIKDRVHDLLPGYCGILEPRSSLIAEQVIKSSDIDAAVVPGSVFDGQGGRLGYGGGYYDRFLEPLSRVVRIGAAFDLQLVKKVPLEKHDQLMDYVVTETKVIKGRNLIL